MTFTKKFASKKLLAFLSTILVSALVVFAGVDEKLALELVEKIIDLAMVYLGGQSAVDAVSHIGKRKPKVDEHSEGNPQKDGDNNT